MNAIERQNFWASYKRHPRGAYGGYSPRDYAAYMKVNVSITDEENRAGEPKHRSADAEKVLLDAMLAELGVQPHDFDPTSAEWQRDRLADFAERFSTLQDWSFDADSKTWSASLSAARRVNGKYDILTPIGAIAFEQWKKHNRSEDAFWTATAYGYKFILLND